MIAQARRVCSAINNASVGGGEVIIVGDTSNEIKYVHSEWVKLLPDGWKIHLVSSKNFLEGGENYKTQAQLLIADMRTTAFSAARKLGATHCWSLDSDTLPQPNSLRVMLDCLNFDNNFYGVAMCPYPNTSFLGGRGTLRNQIAEDWLPEERDLPEWLSMVWERSKKWTRNDKNIEKRIKIITNKIKKYPPKGNVFELNSKKWRRRGWLENAYPGIGIGSVVPTDWVGFGCTLLSEKALALAHFEGYEGSGTEDLFIGWSRWYPAGVKMAVIPHCPADHVIWSRKKGGSEKEYILHHVYHEQEGECVGHLRVKQLPWRAELATI